MAVLPPAQMLLVITIARMTIVHTFIVKILLTTLTPPLYPNVYTRNKKTGCPESITYLILILMILSQSKQYQTDASSL